MCPVSGRSSLLSDTGAELLSWESRCLDEQATVVLHGRNIAPTCVHAALALPLQTQDALSLAHLQACLYTMFPHATMVPLLSQV
jgi:hypothetical protein